MKPTTQPIQRPIVEDHPVLQSDALAGYISVRSKAGTFDLHSAFQLHHECVRIRRFGYRQPAWNHPPYIRELYGLFMHCLTAKAFGCTEQFQVASKWFEEDIPLFKEKRRHHFASRLHLGATLLHEVGFLRELAEMRSKYEQLSDEDGPFHVEMFPYQNAAPELELLHPGSRPEFSKGAPLDGEVEALIVELLTGPWS